MVAWYSFQDSEYHWEIFKYRSDALEVFDNLKLDENVRSVFFTIVEKNYYA